MYQGGSGDMLPPHADLALLDPGWGLDFEAEICVILRDTPIGTNRAAAERHVALLMLANDVTYRNLIPDELAKGVCTLKMMESGEQHEVSLEILATVLADELKHDTDGS